MRINKFVAQSLGCSRRTADTLIEHEQVSVNGTPARVGQTITESDTVTHNGRQLKLRTHTYILLNKPVGYVCSRKQQDDAETIYSLLPQKYHHLKTAGRLDKDTSGVILLTDDGDYIQELTHPSSHKKKVYETSLDRPLSDRDLNSIQAGVTLTDGLSSLQIEPTGESNYKLTMHEGRNRQIRRTFGALGYTVVSLDRIQFGPYMRQEDGDMYRKTEKNPN